MQEALKLAIEGGWLPMKMGRKDWVVTKDIYMQSVEKAPKAYIEVTLDPTFWQSLGKALGWERDGKGTYFTNWTSWQYMWHRFIDHIAEGKDADSFFKEIISNHNKE